MKQDFPHTEEAEDKSRRKSSKEGKGRDHKGGLATCRARKPPPPGS